MELIDLVRLECPAKNRDLIEPAMPVTRLDRIRLGARYVELGADAEHVERLVDVVRETVSKQR